MDNKVTLYKYTFFFWQSFLENKMSSNMILEVHSSSGRCILIVMSSELETLPRKAALASSMSVSTSRCRNIWGYITVIHRRQSLKPSLEYATMGEFHRLRAPSQSSIRSRERSRGTRSVSSR